MAFRDQIHKSLFLITLLLSFFLFGNNFMYASGGFDNGTSIGKGKLGLDLTLNPFNYWRNGQSYAVISYGINENLDIHGYYSIPVKGSDNYYIGFLYQFLRNKHFDLASAIGIRKYSTKSDTHLFFPQFLYTINLYNDLRIGGSIVNIINVLDKNKRLGSTIDIGLIIPVIKKRNTNHKIDSVDLTLSAFRPALWKPGKYSWHPTYSIDVKLN